MFIVRITYTAPISEVDKYVQAHRDFLDYHYKQGLFILSGPTIPRTGGILVATGVDKARLEAVLKEDPYHLAEIAEYEIIPFTPVKHCEQLKDCIQQTEGKLC